MTSPLSILRSSSQFWNDFNSMINSSYLSKSGNTGGVSYTINNSAIYTGNGDVFYFPVTATYNGNTYFYRAIYNYDNKQTSLIIGQTMVIIN